MILTEETGKGKIPKGTKFEELPDDWHCPVCGAGKKMFKPLGRYRKVRSQNSLIPYGFQEP